MIFRPGFTCRQATGCTVDDGCDTVRSSNVIAELTGTEFPDEVIAIGGHIDSWDVGQGAIDDAGGAFAAWEALKLLNDLGLRPKRTIRAIMWNAEENSGAGANDYYARHSAEKHLAVFESDGGVWAPYAHTFSQASVTEVEFEGLQKAGEQLTRIGAGNVTYGGGGADTQVWCQAGTPCGSQVVLDPFTGRPPTNTPEGSGYFWYHHTDADMMTGVKREQIDLCVAAFAGFTWTLAEYGFAPPPAEPLPYTSAALATAKGK